MYTEGCGKAFSTFVTGCSELWGYSTPDFNTCRIWSCCKRGGCRSLWPDSSSYTTTFPVSGRHRCHNTPVSCHSGKWLTFGNARIVMHKILHFHTDVNSSMNGGKKNDTAENWFSSCANWNGICKTCNANINVALSLELGTQMIGTRIAIKEDCGQCIFRNSKAHTRASPSSGGLWLSAFYCTSS